MITLSSDFGSPYPAAMKGVILSRTDALLIDIAHDFPRQDIRTASFWLREVIPWFPPAVHLVVIDPGVGTDREALVIRTAGHALVGPDNGVLLPVARRLDGELEVFTACYSDPESRTFHGRDVFAPIAAEIHEKGINQLHELSTVTPTDQYEPLSFPEPVIDEESVVGEVLCVDGFGNVITNIPGQVIDHLYDDRILVNGDEVWVYSTYGEAAVGDRLVTVGSHGQVELAVNHGRGENGFGVRRGDTVRLEW